MNTYTTKTPPGSFTSSPLTPPPTEEKIKRSVPIIVKEIQSRKDGAGSTEAWIEYQLDKKEYKELLRLLGSDESLWGFVGHKLRYDFSPAAKQFVFRMLTGIHEIFLKKVVKDLESQLASIATSQSSSAEYAQNIEADGSRTISFGDLEYGSHQPDDQFQYSDSPYPCVIIEVSYSQTKKKLRNLADDYILGSDGNIRVVVGIDIEYGGSKATLSVWQPRITSNDLGEKKLVAIQVVVDQMFRDDNDNPNTSTEAGLNLKLQDFVPETSTMPLESLDDQISIPAATLYRYLKHAEEKTRNIDQKRDISWAAKPKTEKERRDSTPAEEIQEEDKKIFREKEKKAAEKAEKDGSSCITSSTSDAESSG